MDHTVLVQNQAEIFEHYNSSFVAAGYARQEYITPCEQLLFSTYLRPGMAILDIGVGGGRTSPCLAKSAARYVGLDFAPEMVRLCRRKYPQWEFCEGSAVDLSRFQKGSFDAVVMSYNILDDLIPDESRWQCLQECHRVLRNSGVLIFSSHNPRAVIARHEAATPGRSLPVQSSKPTNTCFDAVTDRIVVFIALARLSLEKAFRHCLHLPFWYGEGYMLDSEKLMTHFCTPKNTISELERYGFQCIAVQGDDYPQASYMFTTDWYYYVSHKARQK
jgi:ubiquinone/menaquinone biosynthesis C-methylase UbiE